MVLIPQEFVDLLNAMRFAQLDDRMCKTLEALKRPVTYTDGIEPTELYPTRVEVQHANQTRLDQLMSPIRRYTANDRCGVDASGNRIHPDKMATLLDRVLAPKELDVKLGAQVSLKRLFVLAGMYHQSLFAGDARQGMPVVHSYHTQLTHLLTLELDARFPCEWFGRTNHRFPELRRGTRQSNRYPRNPPIGQQGTSMADRPLHQRA